MIRRFLFWVTGLLVAVLAAGLVLGVETARSESPFGFVVDQIETCGETCRDVTTTPTNRQSTAASDVTVTTRIYAGNGTDGDGNRTAPGSPGIVTLTRYAPRATPVGLNRTGALHSPMSSTTEGNSDADSGTIEVSEAAASEAIALLEGEDMDTDVAGLRLFVQQGGCAGLSYGMRFEHGPDEDDAVYVHHGLRVFVDPASLNYIEGSVLDYEGGLQGAGFHVENPNVVSECGCGESFRT